MNVLLDSPETQTGIPVLPEAQAEAMQKLYGDRFNPNAVIPVTGKVESLPYVAGWDQVYYTTEGSDGEPVSNRVFLDPLTTRFFLEPGAEDQEPTIVAAGGQELLKREIALRDADATEDRLRALRYKIHGALGALTDVIIAGWSTPDSSRSMLVRHYATMFGVLSELAPTEDAARQASAAARDDLWNFRRQNQQRF